MPLPGQHQSEVVYVHSVVGHSIKIAACCIFRHRWYSAHAATCLSNLLPLLQGAAAKLGGPIKNKHLADIVAHRRDAPVRSLKWLVGILDNVLKQVDANQKQGSASKLKSFPDIALQGFQRKYGDVMAADYMSSLVNTVARYRQVSWLFAVLHTPHLATWDTWHALPNLLCMRLKHCSDLNSIINCFVGLFLMSIAEHISTTTLPCDMSLSGMHCIAE